MTTPLQQAAIEYVGAGLRILALTGKKPNGRVHGESWSWEDSFWTSEPLGPRDVEAIEQAFDAAKATTGIAILIPPDFLVADVDSDRAAALLLELGYEADAGSIVSQTRNGLHIWFWWPGADSNRWLGDGQLPDPNRTLLFKGLGGYVVAPPSEHPDGGTYQWGTPLVKDGKMFMPDVLPEEAGRRFESAERWAADKAEHKTVMTSFEMVPQDGVPWYQWPIEMHYALEGLEKAIIGAADGNQNNMIHWASMVAKEEGVPYDVAMKRLMAAARNGGHPESRARDTIRSVYKRSRGQTS